MTGIVRNLVLVLIGVALWGSFACGQTCEFSAPLSTTAGIFWVDTPTAVRNCFTAVALTDSVRSQTLAQLHNLINLYSFSDIVQAAPPPYALSVHLNSEIDTVGNEAPNDFDFHMGLNAVFAQLEDAHTQYIPPQVYSFALLHPFTFGVSLASNNQLNVVAVDESAVFQTVTYSDLSGVSVSENVGKNVTSIDGVSAATFIQNVGNRAGISKNEGARFNLAQQSLLPAQTSGGLPEKDSWLYEFSDGTSAEYPIVVIVLNNIQSPDDIQDNLLRSSDRKRTIVRPLPLRTIEDLAENWPPAPLVASREEHGVDPLKELREAAHKLNQPSTMSEDQKREIARKFQQSATERREEQERKSNLPSNSSGGGGAPSVSYYHFKSLGGRAHPRVPDGLAKRQEGGQPALVASSDFDALLCYEYTDETMLFVATTFLPSGLDTTSNSDVRSFLNSGVAALRNCIEHADSTNRPNIIFDLRSNGGGFITLAYSLLSMLAPEWSNSLSVCEPYNLRKTNLVTQLVESDFVGNGQILPSTGDLVEGLSWYNDGETQERGGVLSNFSQKIFLVDCASGASNDYNTADYYFTRIISLTDGLCGSACALFISKLQFYGKTMVVGIGGRPESPLDASSFPGGNVYEWDDVVRFSGLSELDYFPTTATARFNFFQLFMGTQQTPKEFVAFNVDRRLAMWSADPTNHAFEDPFTSDVYTATNLQFDSFQATQVRGDPYPTVENVQTVGTTTGTTESEASSLFVSIATLVLTLGVLLFAR